jgi:creatinine amidohydrolase
MSYYYGEQTWPQLEEAIKQNTLVIIPVGTTEEHGRHLPVETDAMIAKMYGDAIADELQKKQIPVLLTQPVYYGYSMNIVTRWPGTLKIRTRVFMDYVYDMIDALMRQGFKKVALLDCHGNHDGLLRTVMREIADAHDRFICTLAPAKLSQPTYNKLKKDPEGDIHGGEWETSMILAYRPDLVNKAEYTNVDAITCNNELRGPVSTWGLQKTKTGLFGDPTYATAELGQACLEAGTEAAVRILEQFMAMEEE